MPITYKGLTPAAATNVNMTDDNVGPFLLLWLIVTTNQTFFDPTVNAPATPPLDDAAKTEIATKLGLTLETVTAAFTIANDPNNIQGFQQVASLFSSIASASGYDEDNCPGSYQTILKLATPV